MSSRRRAMMANQGELPSGYTKLTYLESNKETSHTYILTNLIPADYPDGFEMIAKTTLVANGTLRYPFPVLVGFEQSDAVYKSSWNIRSNEAGFLQFANYLTVTSYKSAQTMPYVIDAVGFTTAAQTISIDGVAYSYATYDNNAVPINTIVNPKPLSVFCRYDSNGGYASDSWGDWKLWYLEVKDVNLDTILYLIPAMRAADSKPGLYDTVSKTFFTNQGTGEFGYELMDGTYVAPV